PMCLTAMYFVGIDRVYYASSVEEAVEVGLGKSKLVYEDLKKPREEREIKMVQMPLQEGQANPMHVWNAQSSKDRDRKSTRLNSSHVSISYAVFCLKKKKK